MALGTAVPFFYCVSRSRVRDGINVTCLYSEPVVWVCGSDLGEHWGSHGMGQESSCAKGGSARPASAAEG